MLTLFTWIASTPVGKKDILVSAHTKRPHLILTPSPDRYSDLLVHGPLTAIMLIEVLLHNGYAGQINNFEYRARNPVYVDRQQHVCAAIDVDNSRATLWVEDDDGVVGMTGSVDLEA